MPRSSGKKRKGKPKRKAETSLPLDPLRRGMPAQDSITGVKELKRGGKVYRIINTTEMDEYDRPPASGRRNKPRR
jgi:hypothetical protein